MRGRVIKAWDGSRISIYNLFRTDNQKKVATNLKTRRRNLTLDGKKKRWRFVVSCRGSYFFDFFVAVVDRKIHETDAILIYNWRVRGRKKYKDEFSRSEKDNELDKKLTALFAEKDKLEFPQRVTKITRGRHFSSLNALTHDRRQQYRKNGETK